LIEPTFRLGEGLINVEDLSFAPAAVPRAMLARPRMDAFDGRFGDCTFRDLSDLADQGTRVRPTMAEPAGVGYYQLIYPPAQDAQNG
jgi:hypothetical protein